MLLIKEFRKTVDVDSLLPRAVGDTLSRNGGISLGWILAAAIGGGAVVAACLGFLLAHIHRRRQRTRLAFIQGLLLAEDVPKSPSFGPRKLTKYCPEPVMTQSTDRDSLPHVLPPMSRKSSLNVPIRTPSEPDTGRNKAWVNENTITQPRIALPKGVTGGMHQNPWNPPPPPHMPEQPMYDDEEDEVTLAPRPVYMPTRAGSVSRLPPSQTFSHQVAEPINNTARSNDYHQLAAGHHIPRASVSRPKRESPTDNELAEILRSTEQRLQDGTSTPRRPTVANINRTPGSQATSAPRSPLRTPLRIRSIGKAGGGGGYRSRSVSPMKLQAPVRPSATGSHQRQPSQSSMLSEADSLVAETNPPTQEIATGLSSPSRNSRYQDKDNYHSRSLSMTSQVSSSLSTVYSADEPIDEPCESGRRTGVDSMECATQWAIDNISDPPALSAHDDGEQHNWSQEPPLDFTQSRTRSGTLGQDEIPDNHERGQIGQTLASEVGGEKEEEVNLEEYNDGVQDVFENSGISRLSIILPAPQVPEPSDLTRPKVATSRNEPVFVVTSPSDASGRTPTPSISRRWEEDLAIDDEHDIDYDEDFTPPRRLRAMSSSPTLGGLQRVCSQPAPAKNAYESEEPQPFFDGKRFTFTNPGSARSGSLPTDLTDLYNHHGNTGINHASPGTYEQKVAPLKLHSNSASVGARLGQGSGNSLAPFTAGKDMNRLSVISDTSSRDGSQVSYMEMAVGELRRMDSQASHYSLSSTHSLRPNGGGSPTLSALRGGGFSSARDSTQVRAIGARNFLTLGTPGVRANSRLSERSIDVSREDAEPRTKVEPEPDVEDKENEMVGLFRVPNWHQGGQEQMAHMKRISDDISEHSLELYDNEGFLISSPQRGSWQRGLRA
jgi:hypothetical protein